MSRKVIMVPDNEPKVKENRIKFTHYLGESGWRTISNVEETHILSEANKIVYLGNCKKDGDMFIVYKHGFISTYKGFLNSGTY